MATATEKIETGKEIMLVDATDKVLGRMATQVAKMILNGHEVAVVNAENAFISGHKRDIISNYKEKLEWQDKANPEHSPYVSRRADLFVKRVIRGMLPFKKPKGKAAFKLLKVYIGFPEEFKKLKPVDVQTKPAKQIFESTMKIKDLVSKLGYNKE
ncbi:MAG: 50S ribosomal protein L13 [Candidatus Micrarchaeota archaeon]|nr:50S ribosomal protein L13 [Candidatus Micrarchaeota archaeon]